MNTSIHIPSLSRRWLGLMAGIAAVSILAVAAAAAGELKHSDQTFLEKVAKAGQKELQVSQIAVQRANNPRIREYAQTIVSDYDRLNSDLAELAAKKGFMPPVAALRLDKWSEKKATDFDKDYISEMASEHEDTISLFEKAAKSEDADIAAFAQKYLPKLQAHYTAAKDFKKMY